MILFGKTRVIMYIDYMSENQSNKNAHIIVFGNEKGGSGKTTTAMHVAVGLLRLGYKVATIDLDSHQASLTSYVENRQAQFDKHDDKLPMPEHFLLESSEKRDLMENHVEEQLRLQEAIDKLSKNNDFIVMDTPGSNAYLSIMGHFFADTIVTPVNDSFIDLDLIAKIEPDSLEILKTSHYSDFVTDIRNQRFKKDAHKVDWVVMRNRLNSVSADNKANISKVLNSLEDKLEFRQAPGFSERVIFRELFLQGLTLLDLKKGSKNELTISNIAARQEVRHLIKMILPSKSAITMSLLQTA